MAQSLGFNITELKVQVTVRDGGTFSAKNNGIDKNLYLLPVEIMPEDEVQEYFYDKAHALIEAVTNDVMPELCDYEDRWGGRRCKGYCPVFMYCPEGSQVNKVRCLA